jgi:hypothetical protein
MADGHPPALGENPEEFWFRVWRRQNSLPYCCSALKTLPDLGNKHKEKKMVSLNF